MTKKTGAHKLKQDLPLVKEAEPKELIPESKPGLKSWLKVVCGAGAVILVLSIYLLRLDDAVGMIVDDAWYVLLAKALATGQGYSLINSPSPGIMPFYPPGFPFLLSLVYRLWPHFPQNLWLLKAVSIAAMMGLGVLSYFYFKRDREQPPAVAFGMAVAAATIPSLVFLATSSVMSECVFSAIQLLSIVAMERCVREGKGKQAWRYALLGGSLVALSFLTRSMAIGLVVAAAAYLLKARLWQSAAIYTATVVLLVGPWMLYSRAHAVTPEQRLEQGGSIVQSYGTQFWQQAAGYASSGTISADELPERVWQNVSEIVKYDVGSSVFYSLFRTPEPGEKMRVGEASRMLSLGLSVLLLIGFISMVHERITLAEIALPLSLATTLTWGWEQFRLLLPLLPFFIFYLLMGVRAVQRAHQRLHHTERVQTNSLPLLIAVCLVVVFNVQAHVKYIQRKYNPVATERVKWVRSFEENQEMFNWMRERLPKEEVITAQNPALVHLYTGHKTVTFDEPAGHWEKWKQLGIRYLVRSSPYPLPHDPTENKYKLVYRQPGALNLRIVDFGPQSSRVPWESAASAGLAKPGSLP